MQGISVKYIPKIHKAYKELEYYPHILITRDGMAYDSIKKEYLRLHIDVFGYHNVQIGNKNYLLHRLVAIIYVTKHNPKASIVCHKNKNRGDNRPINLMWATNSFIAIRRENFRFDNKGKKIIAYTKDGAYVKTFKTAGQAERELKLNRSEIYRCCKKERKTTGGYTFRYYDDPIIKLR